MAAKVVLGIRIMSEKRTGSSGPLIVGLLIGSAVGAVTGLLLAPRSGRETRQLLKKSADALPELAEDLSSSVQVQADRLSGSALRNWDSTLVRLKEAIRAGANAASTAAGLEANQRESSASGSGMKSSLSSKRSPNESDRPLPVEKPYPIESHSVTRDPRNS